MKYQTFLQQVAKTIQEQIEDGDIVKLRQIQKNNGLKMMALTIETAENKICSPLIYMEPFYQMYKKGRTIESLADEIRRLYEVQAEKTFDRYMFFDYRKVSSKIAYRIVNYEKNEELLSCIPHKIFLDFALIYYLVIEIEGDMRTSAIIYKDHLKAWGISEEELHEDALKNTRRILPEKITPLDQLIEQMLKERMELGPSAIYVLTNEACYYGAGVIFYPKLLEQLAEQLQGDFYLLPSSVHEFLAVPIEVEQSAEALEQIVHNVNQVHVSAEEFLSDHVYRYVKAQNRIVLAGQREI